MPLFSRRSSQASLPKSHYYVSFLGAREARGLRGDDVALPVLQRLAYESDYYQPIKVTLQLSNKGMKILQPVPMIHKSGRIRMELLKFLVPHYSICYASVPSEPPLNDCLAVVMLIYNPETRCPVHVHCYRCDSVQTANLMNLQLQTLINRPENAQRFADLEFRLMAKGLLPPLSSGRSKMSDESQFSTHDQSTNMPDERFKDQETSTTLDRLLAAARMAYGSNRNRGDYDFIPEQDDDTERMIKLHQALFHELKTKMAASRKNNFPLLFPPRDYLATWKPPNRQVSNNGFPQGNPRLVSNGNPGLSNADAGIHPSRRPPANYDAMQYHPRNDIEIRAARYAQVTSNGDQHRQSSGLRVYPSYQNLVRTGLPETGIITGKSPSGFHSQPFKSSNTETSSTSGLGSDAESSGGGTSKRTTPLHSYQNQQPNNRGERKFAKNSAAQHLSNKNSVQNNMPRDKALARRYNLPINIDDSNSDLYAAAPLKCFGDSLRYEIRSSANKQPQSSNVNQLRRLRNLGQSTSALPDRSRDDDASTTRQRETSRRGATRRESVDYCDPQELEVSASLARLNVDPDPSRASVAGNPEIANNWITKPSRFFSMDDLTSQIARLDLPGARASLAPTQHQREPERESLWHLPAVVDPFGKRYEHSSNLLTGGHHHARSKAQSAWDIRRASWYVK